MKKFFAALMAISITAYFAGCGKTADGQLIDEFSEYNDTAESSEIYGASCLAQQEDMLGGAWVSNNNLYFFVSDNIYETTGCEINALNAVIKNGGLDTGEAADGGNMFLYDNAVYINSVSERPVSVLIYERYKPKPLSADDLEGHCQIYKNNIMLGEAYFENGKGTINGSVEEFPAEIYVNSGKITMTIDGEASTYDYYIIDKKIAQKSNSAFTTMSAFPDSCTYIYLVNGNDFIAIKKSKIITEARTEKTTEAAESVTEISDEPENIFADYDESKFPTGTWQDNYTYAYERDENGNIKYAYYDENEKIISVYDYKNYAENDNTYAEPLFRKDSHIYEFDGKGHFRVSLQTHDAFGGYTFENNVLTLTFRTDFGDEGVFINRFSFETVKEKNGYQLYLDTSKSTEMIELPSVIDMEQVSYMELSAGLSSLFDNFYKRKSFFIEYIDEANADNFKSYIEYIN